MTQDRLDDLTTSLRELINARDIIKGLTDLTEDDKASVLGPLGDSITDCEYLMKAAYDVLPPRDTMERDESRAYLAGVL